MSAAKKDLSPRGDVVEQKPSVGRIVHYSSVEDENVPPVSHAAMIINCREPGVVDLKVWFQSGTENQKPMRPFAEKPTAGHWNWPPRV